MRKDVYSKTLIEIGSLVGAGTNASFDPERLSGSTVHSLVSHINLLKRNNIPLVESVITNDVHKLLDSLKLKNGKPLKDSYKFQIGMTIKRLFPNVAVDLRRYNRNRIYEPTRVSSPHFMANVMKIIKSASQLVKKTYKSGITDIGVYNTALVILLSISTSLRITEILQLKMTDIPLIRNRQSVNIRTKGSTKPRTFMPNETLLSVLLAIEHQRSTIVDYMSLQVADMHVLKMQDRLRKNFIVLCSESYMRRKLKELAAPVIKLPDNNRNILGFNIFRRATTTLLVSEGGHDVAQAINNHSDLNTTLKHYNVQSVQASEDAFNRLETMRRELFPKPLITANDVRLRQVNRQPITSMEIDMNMDDDDDDDVNSNNYRQVHVLPDSPPPSNAPAQLF
uniref:VLF-1 n=1 Tax=Nilaparvata lugens endogenous nudivirus TaxID=1487700 RepID=X5GE93_9VIRU|nr:VLF-1 [Nilaparvata lugens endogenous nudivirus]